MKKSTAEKKFLEAMDALHEAGEHPVNYCLGYVRGCMVNSQSSDYLHEWDDGYMRIHLSDGEQIH